MKKRKPGDTGKAVCFHCQQLRNMTYQICDIPFSDGYGSVKDILAGVCDQCHKVIAIPQESTANIKLALEQRRQAIGQGLSIEKLYEKVLQILEGQKQIEVSQKTGVHPSQISRIKKGFQSRDTQAILKIIEVLGKAKIIGPHYDIQFPPFG